MFKSDDIFYEQVSELQVGGVTKTTILSAECAKRIGAFQQVQGGLEPSGESGFSGGRLVNISSKGV